MSDPEKSTAEFSVDAIDDSDKDEALKLVGLERRIVYTEEQYNAVRKKLVRTTLLFCLKIILPKFAGSSNFTAVHGYVRLSISV